MNRSLMLLCAALSSGLALADHNHVTIDTPTGSPGDRIRLVAGYYATESGFSIASGALLFQGAPMEYLVRDRFPAGGPLGGFSLGDELKLTSDYYAFTGRLTGGDFAYEVRSVVRTGQPAPVAAMVWGVFEEDGSFTPGASSAGASRAARSVVVGLGGHDHTQAYAFAAPGRYDVTLIAWDLNGRYADSEPLTVSFFVPCAADFDASGFVDSDDFVAFVADFAEGCLGAGEPGLIDPNHTCGASADFDASGFVDSDDFAAFVGAFESGC